MVEKIEKLRPIEKPKHKQDREQLKKEVEETKKNASLLGWFKSFFEKIKEKGLKAALVGSLVGLLNMIIGKKAETSNEGGDEKEPSFSLEEIGKWIEGISPQKEFDHNQIISAPFERGKPSEKYPKGVTLCSKTAYLNLVRLGGFRHGDFFNAKHALKEGRPRAGIPVGDAHDVMDYYMKFDLEKYVGTPNKVIIDQLKTSVSNLVDLVVKSSSYKWEHRAVAFRSNADGNWYVLDPYRAGRSEKPVPIEEYSGNIKIAVPLSVSSIVT